MVQQPSAGFYYQLFSHPIAFFFTFNFSIRMKTIIININLGSSLLYSVFVYARIYSSAYTHHQKRAIVLQHGSAHLVHTHTYSCIHIFLWETVRWKQYKRTLGFLFLFLFVVISSLQNCYFKWLAPCEWDVMQFLWCFFAYVMADNCFQCPMCDGFFAILSHSIPIKYLCSFISLFSFAKFACFILNFAFGTWRVFVFLLLRTVFISTRLDAYEI